MTCSTEGLTTSPESQRLSQLLDHRNQGICQDRYVSLISAAEATIRPRVSRSANGLCDPHRPQ
jgi:hypothetical protein